MKNHYWECFLSQDIVDGRVLIFSVELSNTKARNTSQATQFCKPVNCDSPMGIHGFLLKHMLELIVIAFWVFGKAHQGV
jgi:uncharacterized membrane protein YqjE